jgi:hypothetical protein
VPHGTFAAVTYSIVAFDSAEIAPGAAAIRAALAADDA